MMASEATDADMALSFTTPPVLVGDAHGFASRALLELFTRERALLRRLRVVKSYLLLAQGDFYVNLMDVAEPELRKDVADASLEKV